MSQPIPVVITDVNGNLVSISGASVGVFVSAPTAVMPTDTNGNPLTLTGATSGSQLSSPTPIVLCDSRGYAYSLPVVVTSNGSSVITIAATTQGSGRKGQPFPVCITDNNGNPLTISGATLGAFVAAPRSVCLTDYRGYPVTLSLSANTQEVITTIAGNYATYGQAGGFAGDGGIPTSAALANPSGIGFDAAGNLYICDIANGRVRCINTQSTTQVIWGVSIGAGDIQTVAGIGTNAYSGDGGQASSAALGHVCFICFDASGNAYLADQQNGAIRKVTPAGVISTLVGGSGGHAYNSLFPGDNIPFQFTITSVATASGGNTVYTGTFPFNISNGSRLYIQGFTNAANNGWYLSVGTGTSTNVTLANASGVAETHAATAGYANCNFPQGACVFASGVFLVADTNNGLIRAVNTTGSPVTVFGTSIPAGYIKTIAGSTTQAQGYSGDGGAATSATMAQPVSCTIGPDGSLYIADYGNQVVRKVTTAGIISTWAGVSGTCTITGVVAGGTGNKTVVYSYTGTAPITSGQFNAVDNAALVTLAGCTSAVNNGPYYITAIAAGTFTINNFQGGVSESEAAATATFGISGYSGDGGQATSAKLYNPFVIVFDAAGNAYILDASNQVIRKVTPAGIISTYAGNNASYGPPVGAYAGDGGLATSAGLFGPTGLLLDSNTNLYIAEFYSNTVRKVSTVSNPTAVSLSPSSGPQGGGTSVTITGTGFLPGATVTIGGASATSVVVVSSTSITCATPAGTIGTANVTVTLQDGQAGTLSNGYTYISSALLIASGLTGLHGTGAQASPLTLNTTGSTLLVAVLAGFTTAASISDSNTNSWTYLTDYTEGNSHIRIGYVHAPTVGAGHTFTVGGGADQSAVIYAFSQTLTTVSVYDTSTGANGPLSSPFQPGSITPTLGDVVVCGFANAIGAGTGTIAGTGTDTGWVTPLLIVNATDESIGASCLLYASGSALNPTWTTSRASNSAAIACFKKA